jgi:predicted porin
MKKTLIASAIAAVSFSGAALAAESNLPTVYGNIQYAIAHENIDGGSSVLSHFDNGSTLGVKHDHEIAPGLTGFLKIELDGLNADDKSYGRGQIRLDEAYIGVEGDNFGKIWVGSDDSLYESTIDQIANFYEVGANVVGSYTTGEGDLIQYVSPSFSGLTVGAAVQIRGDGDAQYSGNKGYPFQLAAKYEVDAVSLAFAMDSNDDGDPSTSNENTYGLRAAYSMDNFTVSAEYQTRKDAYDVAGIQGVYTLGANQFALSYELKTDDATDDNSDVVTLQALHHVSDNMYVYFEGYLQSSDNKDINTFFTSGQPTAAGDEKTIASVGAVYYF